MNLRYLFKVLSVFLFSARLMTVTAQSADSLHYYMDEGERLFNEGKFTESEVLFQKAIVVVGKESAERVDIWNNLGNVAGYTGRPELAIEYFQKALKEIHLAKEPLATESSVLKNIAATYSDLKDFPNAFRYLNQAEQLARRSGRKDLIADCLNNKGILYEQTDSIVEAQSVYREALSYYRSVQDIERMSLVYINMGVVSKTLKNYPDALVSYDSALVYARAIPNTFYEAVILNNQGNVFSELGRHKEAVERTMEALHLARQLNQLNLVQDCLESISDQYAASGDYKHALQFHREFSALKDSLINEERIATLSEMEARYEVDKKELQVSKLQTENLLYEKNQTRLAIYIVVLSVILLGVVIAVLIRQRIRKLEQRRKELELIAQTERQERERIAKDMHDELGSGISRITWITASAMRADNSASDKESFRRIEQVAEQVSQGMRSLIWLLNTGDTTWQKFVAMIREMCGQIAEAQQMKLIIHGENCADGRVLKQTAARDLLLLLKEAVHNAARYSEGSEIEIEFHCGDGLLTVSIKDNGKGFDPNAARKGNGVSNMQKRAEAMHGKLEVESSPGNGTRLRSLLGMKDVFTD